LFAAIAAVRIMQVRMYIKKKPRQNVCI